MLGSRRNWILAATLAGLPLVTSAAESVTPGSIGDTLKRPPELKTPAPAPNVSAPARKAPQGAALTAQRITVQRFVFSGNTTYSADALAPLVADYIRKPITLAQLYEAADRITDFYVKNGYSLTSVNVPAQSVKNGVVKLEILEGRIGAVTFDGNNVYSSDRLHAFVTHTGTGTVYRSKGLQQDLLTLNGLPGVATRAVLKPGSEYGTSDVVIKTSDKKIDATASVDNYGRKDVGEFRYSAQIAVNNPLDFADRLQLMGLHSNNNRLNYFDIGYSVPLMANGLKFSADYGYAYFHVPVIADISSSGKNKNVNAGLEMPWVHSYTDSFATSAAWLYTDANADVVGNPLSDTNISLLNLGANGSHAWDTGAVTQFNLSLHSNFRVRSAKNPNGERLRAELDLQHLQPLFWGLQVLANADGVYTPDQLADTERMAIGGPTTVRGFPPSEVRGDRGYFGQLSLRRPVAIGPVSMVPRVFGDYGFVRQFNDLSQPPAADAHEALSSAGIGTDVSYRMFNLRLDWSRPLDKTPVSDGRNQSRVYGVLSASF
jgi:hemolysin activation/secretion protein